MDNHELAIRLASAGLYVFPCVAGGERAKQPLVMWRSASTTEAAKIAGWWKSWPEAAPGIDLAKSGLIVIDPDVKGGPEAPNGWANWQALAEVKNHGVLSAPTCTTPSGGRHVYFRQRPGEKLGNRRGVLPPGIDVRGHGGYVLAPGSVMLDRDNYGPLDPAVIASAPVLPDWLAEALQGVAEPAVAAQSPAAAQEVARIAALPTEGRVAAYKDAGVKAVLHELLNAVEGQRNETLNRAAFRFGQFVGAGWMTQPEAEGLLIPAATSIKLRQSEIRATLRSGLGAGQREPAKLPDDATSSVPALNGHAIAENLLRNSAKVNTISEPVKQLEPAKAIDLPLEPPGLVGAIARWITASARHPQPILSLGAALTVVGTAVGRRIAGPTLSGTHLYIVGLAQSGAGKDHPLNQAQLILESCGMKHHVGPSEFISMPAAVNFLVRSPLALCCMDEFGAFLKRINSRKASGFEGAISKILRTAWGKSFNSMTTPEWAGRTSENISSPAVSLLGMSTPEEFYSSLESADTDNGLLNRFLLLSTPGKPSEREPESDPLVVPESIISRLQSLYVGSSKLGAAQRNDSLNKPKPERMGWGSEGGASARDLYENFASEIEHRADSDARARPFLARTVEMALRIATIIAAGSGLDVVTADDLQAGINIASWSAETMIEGAKDYISDTENQAEAQRIIRFIRKNSGEAGKISHTKLLNGLAYRLKSRDLKDLLGSLIESGALIMETAAPEPGSSGGRPGVTYRVAS